MQNYARDEAGNVWEVDAQGNAVRLVTPASGDQGGMIQTRPGNPYELPTDAAQLDSTRANTARTQFQMQQDQANAPFSARTAAANAAKAEADAIVAQRNAAAQQTGLTPAKRTEIEQGQVALRNLRDGIGELRRLYSEGPGSTKGLSGAQDFLPTERNKQFRDAGERLSAFVATALGLTGQQFNTPAEQKLFIGSYLPTAGDWDGQIENKIASLERLYDNAAGSSAQLLGQEPPPPIAQQLADPDYSAVQRRPTSGDASGRMELAQGEWRTEKDPARAGVNARLSQLLNGGASDEQVKAFLAERGINTSNIDDVLAQRRRNPGLNFAADLETRQVQMTPQEQARNQEGQTPIAAFFGNAANGLTAGALPSISGDPEGFRRGLDAQRERNPIASMLGTIGGGALAAGGAELGAGALAMRAGLPQIARFAPAIGDTAYGAAAGYNEGGNLQSAAMGAGAGLFGGMLGRSATRGLSNTVGGVRDAAVDELRTRGIPLTVGQTLSQSGRVGQMIKGVEDRLTGIPFVGDMVNARRLEGLQGFNRAAMDEALAPIGQTAGEAAGEEAVARAQGLVSRAYDNALGGVRVQTDAPFTADMINVRNQAWQLPTDMADNARYTLLRSVDQSFDPNSQMTGSNFQQALRGLRRDASAVRNQPYGYDFGQVTRGAEDALTGMVERQAPGVVPALDAANQAYGRTGIVRDAVNAARNGSRSGEGGIFMPSQLADAASRNARRFGGNQATPNQPFYDLNIAARDVLPSRVPDSGTAGRLAMFAAPGALGGAGAGTDAIGLTDNGLQTGLGVGALLTAGGTRTGQRLMTGAVANRPQRAIDIADFIRQRQRIGGIFGAPLLVGATQ